MVPVARRIARAGRHRVAVFRLLNSSRGWNDRHTPVDDVRWALGQVRQRLGGDLPISLVGHSLGGRAALLAAGSTSVVSAVALAPWVYPEDGQAGLPPGRQVLIVHGSDDRIAAPAKAVTVAQTLAASASVGFVCIRGGRHAMLRHGRRFDGLAADFAVATVLGTPARGLVGRVLAGERWLEA
jgi:dienelactone hydrolase